MRWPVNESQTRLNMSKSPVKVLERALADGEELEATHAVSRDFYDVVDYQVMDDTQDEFDKKYRELVQLLCDSWGPPAFDDGMGNPGFPKWYEAEFLACWQKGTQVAYVALRHDDKELPFMLVYGLKEAQVPKRGGVRGKALHSEEGRLSTALCGKTVAAVRRPNKNSVVLDFEDGDFMSATVSGTS